MSRRLMRTHAFKLLYQHSFHDPFHAREIIETYFDTNDGEEGFENIDRVYIEQSILGVLKNMDIIDAQIEKHAKGWDKDRLSKVDLAILRLAVYEIMFNKEIPDKTAINEAVELCKEFSTDESPSFVNGILASVLKEVECG